MYLKVHRIDLETMEGFGVSFATYGATLLSVRSGDKDGTIEEVSDTNSRYFLLLFCTKPSLIWVWLRLTTVVWEMAGAAKVFSKRGDMHPSPPTPPTHREMYADVHMRLHAFQVACPLCYVRDTVLLLHHGGVSLSYLAAHDLISEPTQPKSKSIRHHLIQSIFFPINVNDVQVTLQYDTLEGVVAGGSYYGATIGRVCNRIAGAAFSGGSSRTPTGSSRDHFPSVRHATSPLIYPPHHFLVQQ